MVKIKVYIDDWSELTNGISLFLPVNDLSSEIDLSHELCVVDWNSRVSFGSMSLEDINNYLKELNECSPDMTNEYFEALYEVSDALNVNDTSFKNMLFSDSYFFEDVSEEFTKLPTKETRSIFEKEEFAAKYLADNLNIPFAKDMEKEIFSFIHNPGCSKFIDWWKVWEVYELMGFKISYGHNDTSMYIINLDN